MKILISPSKTLNFNDFNTPGLSSDCRLLSHTLELHKILVQYSIDGIQDLMNVSEKIAEINFNRFKNWENPSSSSTSKQAIFAFKGDVYSGLDADSISQENHNFMQDNLRILSGFYGLLRPFDQILPYRLEMGTKLENKNGNNLYKFWGDKITDLLNEDLEDDDVIVNLASEEYFKSINKNKITSKLITPVFKEFKKGNYKVIAIYAKKARGLMSRFLIERQSKSVEDVKLFNVDGYSFDSSLSNDNELVFTR